MRNRLSIAILAALLLSAACSTEPQEAASGGGATPTVEEPGAQKDNDKEPRDRKKDSGAGKDEDASGGGDPEGQKSGASKQRGGDQTSDSDLGNTDGEALAYPAAGSYKYEQSGFEEFCQTTSCEREELPARQSVQVSYKKRTPKSAVVVSEARASDSRVARTTFRFTDKVALITEVFTHFEYEGFEFSDSYHPDPPVEAMRFPLRSGMKWSGSWKDKTSGDYSISVGDVDTVTVNGRSVQALRIETKTTFRGQFDGRSNVTVWFDPERKIPVKSEGHLDVKSAFGRYNTEFSIALSAGPGY